MSLSSRTVTILKQPTRSDRLARLIVLALFAALLFVSKWVMDFLPNIEPITLLIILLTLTYGWRSLLSVYLFVIAQGLCYGFHIWFINYLYIWAILVLVVMLFRRQTSPVFWTVVAGFFGLFFGTLCSIPYWFIGGVGGGVAYIVSGLTFDVTHCIGNVLITAVLFVPLRKAMQQLTRFIPA